MAEHYYRCGRCSKITKSVSVSYSEAVGSEFEFEKDDGVGMKAFKTGGRVLSTLTDYADHMAGGLLVKGLAALCGVHGVYKCTECGHMRDIGFNGEEKSGPYVSQ